MDQMDKAVDKMAKSYKALGGKTALPWAQIIQMILSLLSGCTTTSAKKFAKNHPIALEFMLKNKLRDDMPVLPAALSKHDVDLVAKAGVKTFNATSAADIDDLR